MTKYYSLLPTLSVEWKEQFFRQKLFPQSICRYFILRDIIDTIYVGSIYF